MSSLLDSPHEPVDKEKDVDAKDVVETLSALESSIQADALSKETVATPQMKNKKKKKKKKNCKKKPDVQLTELTKPTESEFPLPLDHLPGDQAAAVRKAFLKERMRTAMKTRRGMRERGDTEERTRHAIANAPPDQLQAAAKFFNGQPECLKKLHELAAQAGLDPSIFEESAPQQEPPAES